MPVDSYIVGYYIYLLIVAGVFLYNCRSWAFIRMTLLYFFFVTLFACLLIYGSAYSLESNLVQWHRDGWLTTFPLTITGGAPDANTIPKNSSAFWQNLIPLLCIFVTFPQAVTRSVDLYQEKTPTKVMGDLIDNYNKIRKVLTFLKTWVPGTISNAYDIGEWIFALVALTSLVSPFPNQNLPLMLGSGFFIVLLAGTNIVVGTGLVSRILKLVIPGIIGAMQRFTAFVMIAILVLISIPIAFLAGSLLLGLANQIFHTNNVNFLIIGIILVLSIGVWWGCLQLLLKVVLIPVGKIIEWMGLEIIDPTESSL